MKLKGEDWLRQVFHDQGLQRPDGRAVFSYKLSRESVQNLPYLVASRANLPKSPHDISTVFCFYGTYWYRTVYEEGPWRWIDVVRDTCFAGQDHGTFADYVTQGMAYLRRPLVRGTGNTRYLGTLVAEAGLPLKLITRGNDTGIRAFLKYLVREQKKYDLSERLLSERAEERGRGSLPRALQQEGVYRVAVKLALAVCKIEARVGEITADNAKITIPPGWQIELPLDLDDAQAEEVFRSLVREARSEKVAVTFRVKRGLIQAQDGTFHFSAALEFPREVSARELTQLFGVSEIPSRFSLTLLSPSGESVPVAKVTTSTPSDKYHVELLRDAKRRWSGPNTLGRWEVEARGKGVTLGPVELINAADLTARGGEPLVLAESKDDGLVLEIVGSGSVRSRSSPLIIAVHEADTLEVENSEELGFIREPHLKLLEIRSSANVRAADGSYVISPGALRDSHNSFRMVGTSPSGITASLPVYLGNPRYVFNSARPTAQ